eukprot:2741887-Rhodomonas_salina.3
MPSGSRAQRGQQQREVREQRARARELQQRVAEVRRKYEIIWTWTLKDVKSCQDFVTAEKCRGVHFANLLRISAQHVLHYIKTKEHLMKQWESNGPITRETHLLEKHAALKAMVEMEISDPAKLERFTVSKHVIEYVHR